MKNLIIITSLLLACLTANAQYDYLKYPDYMEVVNTFFEKYTVKEFEGKAEVRFEKRPDGWHVAVIDYNADRTTLKDALFWDKGKNKYVKTDFKKLKKKESNYAEIDKYKNDWAKNYYRISPYFGYPGWDWDVIKEFKNAETLPDTTLYAVGRAYSSYASNLLNNNSGLANTKDQFVLPEGKNCMTAAQLAKYRYYRYLAINKFNKVAAINPEFQTIIGEIGIKASNEYITSFLDMRVYQNEFEAQKEITDSLYDEFYIAFAKNFLNTCAPNAILFTNGDNDTYPLLYVQSKFGYRTDVMVANYSLLQTNRYINSLREQILDAPGLPISFKPEEISGKKLDLILIKDEKEKTMELHEAIRFVKVETNTDLRGNTRYPYIPSRKFLLQLDNDSIVWVNDKDYIYRNELMILDLLATDRLKRPVYFAVTMGHENFLGLEDYLKLEGLAYRLTASMNKKTVDEFGPVGAVNTAVMFDNLMNRFDWTGLNKISPQEKVLCMTTRNNFHRLAKTLINENKKDSAKLALDKCVTILSNEAVYYDIMMLPFVEDYYILDEFEKGNKIATVLVHNLNNNLDNRKGLAMEAPKNQKDAILQEVKRLAEQYHQQDVLELFR